MTFQDQLLYAAEDAVEDLIGPRLARWTAVGTFVQSVLDDEITRDQFSTLPSEVVLIRRSRSATCSFAVPGTATIAIRDGSWTALVALHELAHLISPALAPHGPVFAGTELWLVGRHCGFDAAVALRESFNTAGIDYREYPWRR